MSIATRYRLSPGGNGEIPKLNGSDGFINSVPVL